MEYGASFHYFSIRGFGAEFRLPEKVAEEEPAMRELRTFVPHQMVSESRMVP